MPQRRVPTRAARTSFPSLLAPPDWGQAGMRPDAVRNTEYWACLGAVALILLALGASALV